MFSLVKQASTQQVFVLLFFTSDFSLEAATNELRGERRNRHRDDGRSRPQREAQAPQTGQAAAKHRNRSRRHRRQGGAPRPCSAWKSSLVSLSLSSLLLRLSFSLLYAKAVIYMSIYARLLISPTQRDLLRGGILGPWRHPWFSGCYVLASNRRVVPDVPRALPHASRLSVLLNRYGVTSVYRHTYTTPPRPSVSGSFLPTDPDRHGPLHHSCRSI